MISKLIEVDLFHQYWSYQKGIKIASTWPSHPLDFFFAADPVVVTKGSVRLRKTAWNDEMRPQITNRRGAIWKKGWTGIWSLKEIRCIKVNVRMCETEIGCGAVRWKTTRRSSKSFLCRLRRLQAKARRIIWASHPLMDKSWKVLGVFSWCNCQSREMESQLQSLWISSYVGMCVQN